MVVPLYQPVAAVQLPPPPPAAGSGVAGPLPPAKPYPTALPTPLEQPPRGYHAAPGVGPPFRYDSRPGKPARPGPPPNVSYMADGGGEGLKEQLRLACEKAWSTKLVGGTGVQSSWGPVDLGYLGQVFKAHEPA